jgi:hypothetical protein
MKKLHGVFAAAVFLSFFGLYSYRLGIEPALMHDDYEYTYPSFSMAERGDFGSPLVGPGLNIERRTYGLIVYYYAFVHAGLIRVFGDAPESIPLANTFHFALLAAVGSFYLMRRRAPVGAVAFLCALVGDAGMVEAARHGRPEITAGFCLTAGVFALWLWRGEGRRRSSVLFAASAALTAGMLAHTSVVFFALALALVFAVPVARDAGPRDVAAALLPALAIPLLYGYFALTDSDFLANLRGQLAPAQGMVMIGRLLLLLLTGEWRALGAQALEFWRLNGAPASLWLGVGACLALPVIAPGSRARAARFFAAVYCLFFLVHFLCLKHFVPSYRAIYRATLYLALAFLAEALLDALAERLEKAWQGRVLRSVAAATLVALSVVSVSQFRGRLQGRPLPFARLRGALRDALLESGARPGDRVFVPSPFGFHLRRDYDVIAQPAPRYFVGRWSPAFREDLRRLWRPELLSVDTQSLCYAMGLAFIRPTWIISWDFDYSTMQPFYQFLRKYPDLSGMEIERGSKVALPAPYGGNIRVYRLRLSEAISGLDRSVHSQAEPCP